MEEQHKKKTEKQGKSERSNRKIIQQNDTNHHIHIDTRMLVDETWQHALSALKANRILSCIRRFSEKCMSPSTLPSSRPHGVLPPAL